MNPALVIALCTLPALIASMVVALNATKLNAAHRAKRAARALQH